MLATTLRMEAEVPGDLMVVDCIKTRAAADKWKSDPKNRYWKNLYEANQLNRILGKENGELLPFSRVSQGHMVEFGKKCGVADVGYFEADRDEYEKWKSQRQQFVSEKDASAMHLGRDAPTGPSRSSDNIIALQKRLSGYYEVYHHATSKRGRRAVSITLLHVQGVKEDEDIIECETHDNDSSRRYFHHVGRIAPINGFLYWELRPAQQDAICYCCSYIPAGEKYVGSTIYGIFLTSSGDETREYPVATKAAMRFIGETPSEAVQNSIIDFQQTQDAPEDALRSRVGGYLPKLKKDRVLRANVLSEVSTTIFPRISNQIPLGAVPFALRMPR